MKIDILLLLLQVVFGLHFENSFSHLGQANRYGYLSSEQIHWQVETLPYLSKKCINDPKYQYVEITSKQPTRKAIVMCNVHARQLITSEICLSWLKQLRNQIYFKHYAIKLFLISNIKRDNLIEIQRRCTRRNQNKVDSNRNFPTDFDHYHSSKYNLTYGGDHPINQPFTICLNQLLLQDKPDLFIDMHSGMDNAAFYQQGINNNNELRILYDIKSKIVRNLRITTLKRDGQPINGHIFADVKVRLQVKYSFLFQTYARFDAPSCFLIFNPSGQQKQNLKSKYVSVLNYIFGEVLNSPNP